jgi:uncharacterized protein YuzE
MIKKLSFFFVLLLIIAGISGCGGNNTPPEVRSYVTTNFPSAKIVNIERDHENTGVEYDITLDNGVEIEFDTHNKWKSIDCEHASITVPINLLPNPIANYIQEQYPGIKVIEAERDSYGYEITLSNRLELIFDAQGNFLRIDR